MLESNPPRNTLPETHSDECGGQALAPRSSMKLAIAIRARTCHLRQGDGLVHRRENSTASPSEH